MGKQKMSFRQACDLVPDDLPDGAYWAMAHEFAGLDYGEGFVELLDDDVAPVRQDGPTMPKRLRDLGFRVCSPWHWQKKFGSECLDYWPSKGKWRWKGENRRGSETDLVKFAKGISS